MRHFYAGLDVGGTKTQCVILTSEGHLAATTLRPTQPGPLAVMATAVAAVSAALDSLGADLNQLTSLGVGFPGPVDPASGIAHNAVNLKVTELSVAATLAQRLGIAVAVDNDVKAAAVGASVMLRAGADLSYLNLGTGVAAATISGGKLVRGMHNEAGEIGHLVIGGGRQLCQCGQRGCLEATLGGRYVAERLSAAKLSLARLVADADAGRPHAAQELQLLIDATATAIQLLALSYGSPAILLGGGIVAACPGLVERVRAELTARAQSVSFLSQLDIASRVAAVPVDQPIAAIGAAEVGLRAAQGGTSSAAG